MPRKKPQVPEHAHQKCFCCKSEITRKTSTHLEGELVCLKCAKRNTERPAVPKPKPGPKTDIQVALIGYDGNAFAILGKVKRALEKAGHRELAKEYLAEATAGDYNDLLATTMRYVEVI